MTIFRLLIFGAALCVLAAPVSTAEPVSTPWFGGSGTPEGVAFDLPKTIKVRLQKGRRSVAISATGRFSYSDLKKTKPVILNKGKVLKVSGIKGGLSVGGKKFTSSVLIAPLEGGQQITVNKRAYRGTIILRYRGGGTFDVVEEVGLEEYLNGVLPREVGADWPMESLKAQAVISRTYVVANIRGAATKGYDVTNDVFSQVYGGYHDEHSATNQAVEATRGEILLDQAGAAVLTFFHSSCGGRTESPQYVWQNIANAPDYLDSIRDTYCKNDPFYDWELNITADSLQRRLKRARYRVGTIKNVKVAKRSPSDRAWSIAVETSQGTVKIPGNAFRLAVGPEALRSTFLTLVKKQGKSFRFEGHGWGHGVGLCQWGARGRAQDGHSYAKILDAYYPKVRLVKAQ